MSRHTNEGDRVIWEKEVGRGYVDVRRAGYGLAYKPRVGGIWFECQPEPRWRYMADPQATFGRATGRRMDQLMRQACAIWQRSSRPVRQGSLLGSRRKWRRAR